MFLSIRLSTVVATAALLRCVPAPLVITAPSIVTDSTAKSTLRPPLTCPAAPNNSIPGTTTQVAGQEYLRTTLNQSRLNLSDVQARVLSNIQSQDACAKAASSGGQNAFSFVSGACKTYDFEKRFCPCAPGDFDIYINTKVLGESKELPSENLAEGVKQIVIFSEISGPAKNFGPTINKSQCAAALRGSSVRSGAFFMNNQCQLSALHDFANCNQTCRGQPIDVLVKIVDPIPMLPILSLCGQTVFPMKDNTQMYQAYVSHAGFGCYRYQEVKTTGGEDCIVTFEKNAKSSGLKMMVSRLSLHSDGRTCRDVLSIYNGKTTAKASRTYHGCSGNLLLPTEEPVITIKFHRGLGSEKNLGFKLEFI